MSSELTEIQETMASLKKVTLLAVVVSALHVAVNVCSVAQELYGRFGDSINLEE